MPALSPIHRQEDAERNKMVKECHGSAFGERQCGHHAPRPQFHRCSGNRGRPPTARSKPAIVRRQRHCWAKSPSPRGRYLQWDGAAERIVNDDEANRLLTYNYREPWKLA